MLDKGAARTIKCKGSYGKNMVHFCVMRVILIVTNVRESKTVLDSGFHAMYSGFRILCLWKLDPGFRSLGFRIPQQQLAGFRIPEAKVDLESTQLRPAKIRSEYDGKQAKEAKAQGCAQV